MQALYPMILSIRRPVKANPWKIFLAEIWRENSAAILASDVVGYSRLMDGDEEGTLSRLRSVRKELVTPKIIGPARFRSTVQKRSA